MLSHHAGSVKVFGILCLAVKGQKGVSVACRAVTQPVALLQQAEVPNHLAALQGVKQVLLHPEGLRCQIKHREEKIRLTANLVFFPKSKIDHKMALRRHIQARSPDRPAAACRSHLESRGTSAPAGPARPRRKEGSSPLQI